MLARRLFASALPNPTTPRQSIRTASNYASPSRSPSTCPSAETKPQSQSSTAPTSRGRSKPPTVQVRPRSFRPVGILPGSTYSPSALSSDVSKLVSGLTSLPRKTAGRRRRRSSALLSVDTPRIGVFSQCQIPIPADYSFTPIPLYPHPLHLHMAFTPAHQPIMANMGTGRYLQPPSKRSLSHLSATAESPFDPPSAPSPLYRLQRGPVARDSTPSGIPIISSGSTSLADHLSVTSALAHPLHHHHLASPPTVGYTSEDPETQLLRMMAEADVKHQLSAEWAFDAAMAKLGDTEAIATAAIKEGEVQQAAGLEEEKAQMAQALEGLDGVLARLNLGDEGVKGKSKGLAGAKVDVKVRYTKQGANGEETEFQLEDLPEGTEIKVRNVDVKVLKIGADGRAEEMRMEDLPMGLGEELGVMLDSVKRKRKKKISKHKYQKRRKATRAQRKRLGK